jgi:hypothetical protein
VGRTSADGPARTFSTRSRTSDGGEPRAAGDRRRRWDNGKPIRETLAADLPLAIDHFRYFAGCIRAQEGSLAELDERYAVAYLINEPLGVVGQIIPWNFPLLDGRVEAGAGAGGGQLRGAQAGGADSGDASACSIELVAASAASRAC